MPAELDERIIDDSYKAVFPLGKEQVASHLCSESKIKLANMRVRLDDKNVITESTDGKVMIQVKVPIGKFKIESFPFDVNPSEAPKTLLTEPQFIPASALDKIAKGFPKRKSTQKHPWQKAALFNYQNGSKEIEVGRSDKQGRPTVDRFPMAGAIAFPPVEDVLSSIGEAPALVGALLDLNLLRRLIEAMSQAGTEYIKLSLWGSNQAVKLESVNKWGSAVSNEVNAVIMPEKA